MGKQKPAEKPKRENLALKALVWCLVVGCVFILPYAAQARSVKQAASIAGVALLIALASLLAGGLLGFLFAIPRTVAQGGRSPAGS